MKVANKKTVSSEGLHKTKKTKTSTTKEMKKSKTNNGRLVKSCELPVEFKMKGLDIFQEQVNQCVKEGFRQGEQKTIRRVELLLKSVSYSNNKGIAKTVKGSEKGEYWLDDSSLSQTIRDSNTAVKLAFDIKGKGLQNYGLVSGGVGLGAAACARGTHMAKGKILTALQAKGYGINEIANFLIWLPPIAKIFLGVAGVCMTVQLYHMYLNSKRDVEKNKKDLNDLYTVIALDDKIKQEGGNAGNLYPKLERMMESFAEDGDGDKKITMHDIAEYIRDQMSDEIGFKKFKEDQKLKKREAKSKAQQDTETCTINMDVAEKVAEDVADGAENTIDMEESGDV